MSFCDVAQYISGCLLAFAVLSPENLLALQVVDAVRLLTFGGLSVHNREGAMAGAAAQPRRLAILALVARAGERGATRSKLIGLLWPDADEAQGRRVLSQSLYALRRDLGVQGCISGTQDLRLNGEQIWCDVAEFERALSTGQLEAAATLYVGAFLDGFRLPTAPEFERWADDERTAIQHRFHEAVEQLARAAEIEGGYDVAVKWWRRRAADDPLNARVAVATMRALAAAGDRAGALREARIFEALIAQELELAPDRAVVQLADELRRASHAQVDLCVSVHPFAVLGAADEQLKHDWSEGLAEEIVSALTQLNGVKVFGRSLSASAAATHTIEGSLRFVAAHVRVTVRLIEAATGHAVWSERFEKEARDSHHAQELIATEIARAVSLGGR